MCVLKAIRILFLMAAAAAASTGRIITAVAASFVSTTARTPFPHHTTVILERRRNQPKNAPSTTTGTVRGGRTTATYNKAMEERSSGATSNEVPPVRKNETSTSTLIKELDRCTSATQAQRVLREYYRSIAHHRPSPSSTNLRPIPLYNSVQIPPGASIRPIADGDLTIQTRLVNKKYTNIMDLIEMTGNRDADRISFTIMITFLASTMSAVTVNQNLPGPEIIRFAVVWVLTFTPLALVGYGLRDAGGLQSLLVQIQLRLLPRYRRRMIQHEAGHVLIAHLLGYPIAGYQANAVKNAVSFYPLADIDKGKSVANLLGFDPPKVRLEDRIAVALNDDKPFFSPEGSGEKMVQEQSVFRDTGNKRNYTTFTQLPMDNNPVTAWPYRGFDDATLDKLSVVSVAGVCAEIIAFGNAEGGLADFDQLRQIFTAAETTVTDREIENRIRFALGYTMTQLRRHLAVLDALAAAMERDATVAECVVAMETCTDASGPIGYERARRINFRNEGTLENLLLGGKVDGDVWEDRYVEGKGGGSRKQVARLTGDDPFYLAIAIAVVFLLWASSGGLALH